MQLNNPHKFLHLTFLLQLSSQLTLTVTLSLCRSLQKNLVTKFRGRTKAIKMARQSLVIGISGVTNGGKTTLCKKLLQTFPWATTVNMDTYFYKEDIGKHVLVPEVNHFNWDVESAVDLEEMTKQVRKLANEKSTPDPPLVFVDGILLYNYGPLESCFDKKYFIELPKEECQKRRSTREYEPMDPPGYFDVVAWPEYLNHRDKIKNQDDIVYLDGNHNQDVLYDRVVNDVNTLLKDLQS